MKMFSKMAGVIGMVLAIGSAAALASDEVCYSLSMDGVSFSKTPEVLCVSLVDAPTGSHEISLRSGMSFAQQTIATFSLNLVSGSASADLNQNVYAVQIPSNSIFNALAIAFDGRRDPRTGKEAGTVRIGQTLLHYTNAR